MKRSWNSVSLILITLFLFFFIFNFRDAFAAPTRHLCHPEQRDAILEFKNEFEIQKPCSDGTPKTKSWANNSDCCYWDGIQCDAISGDVIELDLSLSCLHSQINSTSSLHRLPNLRFLTTLDLSSNYFSGQIPSSLGNLSHLTILDLSNNYLSGWNLFVIKNFSHLTSLRLSDNNFVGEILSSVVNLPRLTSLDLSGNNFTGEIPSSLGNLSRLTSLDLSYNSFVGEIPSSFGNLYKLASLSVGDNKLSGRLPLALLHLTKLSFLQLSNNHFTGTLPPNMSSLSNLELFEAMSNAFTGTLPSSLFTIPSLRHIDLSNNQLNNTLEFGNISSPTNLLELRIGNNNFRGPIPTRSISKLVNLEDLDLSHFNTQGPVDFSIFSHLKSLGYLDLSHLNTTTTIDLNAVLSVSKKLNYLDLSGNNVSVTSKSSVSHPLLVLIDELYLSGCGITKFPELLRTQHNLAKLDISNNDIKGQVPGWLWALPILRYVNLSNNTFVGFERPTKPGLSSVSKSSIIYLFATNNSFTGRIPSFICSLHSLGVLDLSNNNFNGSIPRCLGNFSSTLRTLNLRDNRLGGSLPENISKSLKSLDVGHNQLVGKLPRSLTRLSILQILIVESNRIIDTFPFWLSSLQELQVLVLRSNAFHGPIQQTRFSKLRIIDISDNHFNGTLPSDFFVSWIAMFSLDMFDDAQYLATPGYFYDSVVLKNKGVEMELERIIKIYTAIEFSENIFEGEIPVSIGLLKDLYMLDLSKNAFTGHIPSSMGNLTALESLDVSQNNLSGAIPQELGSLSYLSYMNFSHNQLVGLVPGGTQFRRQPCSSFEDNTRLYGPALDEVCLDIHAKTPPQSEMPESEEDEEEVLSWIAVAIGFIPGLAFGSTIGYILVSYKPEWFTNPFVRNKRRGRSIATTH